VLLAITIIFALFQSAVAFFLFIMSIHGPDSLPRFTLYWLILIQLILWLCFAKFRKGDNKNSSAYLIIIGLASTGTAPGIYFIAEQYDTHKWNYTLANTKIYYVHDELLLAEDGQPFGIKFSFKAEFPYTDYNYITPLLRPQINPGDRKPDPNDMRILNFVPNPALERDHYFKKGITYNIVFDMVPGYLLSNSQSQPEDNQLKSKYCMQYPIENVSYLTRDQFEQIITSNVSEKYEVMLHGTTYGDLYSDRGLVYTENDYNPHDFYTTYKNKQIAECKLNQPAG